MQEEVRKLHFKLRQKEQLLSEFKRNAEEYKTEMAGDMTARSSKLVSLLEKDNISEACTKQQTDEILDLITGDEKVGDEKIKAMSHSILFTAADLKRILHKREDQIEFQANLEQAMAKFEKERDELKQTLEMQIAKDNINYEEMTNKRVQEELKKAREVSEKEAETMGGFLQ